MEESNNIIDFDLDFDEDELFAISTTNFDDDNTAEVLVPEEYLEEDIMGQDNDEHLLDEIPEVSIEFIDDDSAENIAGKAANPMICETCKKRYKIKYHFEKHKSSCSKANGEIYRRFIINKAIFHLHFSQRLSYKNKLDSYSTQLRHVKMLDSLHFIRKSLFIAQKKRIIMEKNVPSSQIFLLLLILSIS